MHGTETKQKRGKVAAMLRDLFTRSVWETNALVTFQVNEDILAFYELLGQTNKKRRFQYTRSKT